jgi:hypothetical protein
MGGGDGTGGVGGVVIVPTLRVGQTPARACWPTAVVIVDLLLRSDAFS